MGVSDILDLCQVHRIDSSGRRWVVTLRPSLEDMSIHWEKMVNVKN